MPTKCLYCDEDYLKNSSILHFIATKDKLCEKCRQQLKYKPLIKNINNIQMKAFYQYEGMLKALLLQYKECHDEALKDVFFEELKNYIKIRYYNYTIMWVPSTKLNKKSRGFDHMQKMLENIGLKTLDGLEKIEEISQNSLSKDKRVNMINNIKVKERIKIPKRILLVDDVITTGSSILGAYRVLKNKDNKIVIIALSYAPIK